MARAEKGEDTPHPDPLPQGERGKKEPRWVVPFLRALERTGEVRAAAEDAGIDYTTAYQRRKHHADFAEAWEEALRVRAVAKKLAEEEEIEALRGDPSTIQSSLDGPPPRAELREELIGAGGQMKRVGEGRWSERKERIFFEELAATANVKRAAKAAGVSPNAVYARRMKHPLFRAKWEAVLETGRAAIEMKLVEAANKSFDPDEIDTGEVEPRVSVAEAIRIVQVQGSKSQRAPYVPTLEEEAQQMSADEVDAVRERLITKLGRLHERRMNERLEQGWSLDEGHDLVVPPGWVKIDPAT